jgi:hypothetical protein
MLANRQSIYALIALALVGIAAFVGYGLGFQAGAGPRMSELKVFRDVAAQSGDTQVSAIVDGVTYGVIGDVPWIDGSGSYHDHGWPACVPQRTQTRITFGGALIYGPTGVGDYRVLWVDCRK